MCTYNLSYRSHNYLMTWNCVLGRSEWTKTTLTTTTPRESHHNRKQKQTKPFQWQPQTAHNLMSMPAGKRSFPTLAVRSMKITPKEKQTTYYKGLETTRFYSMRNRIKDAAYKDKCQVADKAFLHLSVENIKVSFKC